MLKLLRNTLLFLLIPCFAHAGGAVGLMVAGGSAAVSLSDFCTSQSPKCLDCEATTSCYAGYDSVCDFTWDSLTATGGTIDFTTAPPGTYPCSKTTNTNGVLSIIKNSTDATACSVYEAIDAASELWLKAYVYFTVIPASSQSISNIFTFYNGSISNLTLNLQTTAGGQGQLYLRYATSDVPDYTNGSTTNISINTWYKIVLRYKASSGANGVVFFEINDAAVTDVANNGHTATITRIYLGGASNDTDVYSMYVDNANWLSGATEPADCAN